MVVKPITTKVRDEALKDFNGLPTAEIVEVFLFPNATQIEGQGLHPSIRNSTKPANNDRFRHTSGYKDFYQEMDWITIKTSFLKMIDEAPKFPLSHFRYNGTHASEKHMIEVRNIQLLGESIGEDCIHAYDRQNETIDIIVKINNVNINSSLKTATPESNGYKFELGAAPYWWHCDIMMIFYLCKERIKRTHVSILHSRNIYNRKANQFYWSSTLNKDILKDRINLSDVDAAEQIKFQMLKLKETVDNSHEETGRKAANKEKKVVKSAKKQKV